MRLLNVLIASNSLTYLLTPWCRVLLEKLTGLQLVKNSPHFTEPEGSLPHYKLPPPFPILGQPNPVHTPTSHLLEIHPNIIHTFMPRSPQWYLSLRFPYEDPISPHLITHMSHMPSPASNSLNVLIHVVFRVKVHSQTLT